MRVFGVAGPRQMGETVGKVLARGTGMATRPRSRSSMPTSFDIEIEVEEPTPIRPYDLAALDLDSTVANPDLSLLDAERELCERERGRVLPPPRFQSSHFPVMRVAPESRPSARVAPESRPSARVVPPSLLPIPTAEPSGSLAPMAMEMPETFIPRLAPPPMNIAAPPLDVGLSSWPMEEALVLSRPASRGRIILMCGALAAVAAIAVFAVSKRADDDSGPPFRHEDRASLGINVVTGVNAAAPPPAATEIPFAKASAPATAFVPPQGVALEKSGSDWTSRIASKPAPFTPAKAR
jgi:hypothetical protein